MHDKSDALLLREYADHGDEAAFREIVVRHTDLIYSAALRQVASPDLAHDVAQSVFTDLARKAPSLSLKLKQDASILGWLYRSTRFAALNQLRKDQRRQAHERQVMEHFDSAPDAALEWDVVRPVLDEVMSDLNDEDREALLLRYFERHDFRTIGQTLGVSDDAAQKRVGRALERLRVEFNRRGVITTSIALSTALSANAVTAAPAGLSVILSTAALAGATTLAATTTATVTNAIVMTTLQKTLVCVALAALAGAGMYEARQASQLRDQIQTLQEQHAPLVEQIQALQRERDEGKNRLAGLLEDISRWESNPNQTELLKLRGEVTRLKAAENRKVTDPAEAAAKSWADRVTQLKQKLELTPGAKIPEFKYLTEANWLDAASEPLVREEDYRRAFARLRSVGENQMIISMHKALGEYMKQNGGQFPTDLSQLKSHFETLPDDEMLQRYAIVPASQIPNMKMGGDWLITVKNPVDEEFDSLWAMGPKGFGTSTYKGMNDARVLEPVLKAFAAANNGQEPKDSSELLPYLATPEQRAVFNKIHQSKIDQSR